VAIVPPDRWGEMERNDSQTAGGNFKTLISLLHHNKKNQVFFSFSGFFKNFDVVIVSLLLSIAIYRLQVTTFLTLAGVVIPPNRPYSPKKTYAPAP
jgi:hypothetical protein